MKKKLITTLSLPPKAFLEAVNCLLMWKICQQYFEVCRLRTFHSIPGVKPDFTVKVVGSYRDPLSRQVAEGVLITNTKSKILNSKAEMFQPPIVRLRREVGMGS